MIFLPVADSTWAYKAKCQKVLIFSIFLLQVNYDRSLHRSNEINECGGLIDHEALLDEDTYMPTA